MRISDWSSDVCSSDLLLGLIRNADKLAARCGDDLFARQRCAAALDQLQLRIGFVGTINVDRKLAGCVEIKHRNADLLQPFAAGIRRRNRTLDVMHQDRKSVVSGRSVSVRVDLGGRRILKKKNKRHKKNNKTL